MRTLLKFIIVEFYNVKSVNVSSDINKYYFVHFVPGTITTIRRLYALTTYYVAINGYLSQMSFEKNNLMDI